MSILSSSRPTQILKRLDVRYQDYIHWQTEQIEKRKRDEVPDTVSVMTFSNSVYTTPDNGRPKRIDLDDEFLTAKRGGDDTWHGPGQIIVAPVVKLVDGFRVKDLMTVLEGPIRRVLGQYDVTPDQHADGDFPGIQVQGRKIAQLGLFLDERVTSYGLAFNVNCDLSKFSAIDLCGIENCAVTNLLEEANRSFTTEEVVDRVLKQVGEAFQYEDWTA